jgi:hypothetical protein
MASEQESVGDVDAVLREERERVETALVEFAPDLLRRLGVAPDAVVSDLFTPAFVAAATDFADFEEFLTVAGVESLWDLGRWLDWVLDWHVLGNTRFWSWEWMVHAAVVVQATAAEIGPVRCQCGGPVTPVTASDVEEPGRADGRWVEYRCTACDATGRASRAPDGTETFDGLERV